METASSRFMADFENLFRRHVSLSRLAIIAEKLINKRYDKLLEGFVLHELFVELSIVLQHWPHGLLHRSS